MKRFATPAAVVCLGFLFFPIVCNSQAKELSASSVDQLDQKGEFTVDTSNRLVLEDECPDWLNDSVSSDTKCLGAIERYFLDKAVYTLTFPGMVPKQASFTYRTMFNSHESDKKLVSKVLVDPECQLLRGPMRMDLRDQCNAQELFRYNQFANLCHDAREMNWFEPDDRFQGKSRYQQNSGGIEDFESAIEGGNKALDSYYSYRNSLRERVLRDVWLVSQDLCPADFLSPHEWSKTRTKPMEPHRALTEIAARLGDEQTLFADQGCIMVDFGDKAYRQSKGELHAWQGHMVTAIGGIGVVFGTSDRITAIVAAAHGIVGMKEAGYEADIEQIVRRLCGSGYIASRDEAKDCATAYQKAKLHLDPIDLQVFSTLDEIRDTAIELDLYQSL